MTSRLDWPINPINWRDTTHFVSEDDYRTGCGNVNRCQQQSVSGLRSTGRPHSTYLFLSVIYAIHLKINWQLLKSGIRWQISHDHHAGSDKRQIIQPSYVSRLGSFSNDDGDGYENVETAIGLLNETSSLQVHYAFLFISLPLLHDYDVKMPNFTFYGGRKQGTGKFSFSF